MASPIVLMPTQMMTSAAPTTATPHKVIQNNNKRLTTLIIYPTVSPESVIIPIVSCILGFPLLALMVICCLRRRAKLARERARRRNCGMTNAGLSLVRLGAARPSTTPSVTKAAGRDRGSMDLDTVLEERSEHDLTQVELMTPDKEDRLQIGKLMSQPARYFLEGGR